MNNIWLILFGNICRYTLIETLPDAYGCYSHVRARLDCDGSAFELVGRLSRRSFEVTGIRIADRLIPEKHSLKVFSSFGDAYAYQSLGEKGINEAIRLSTKEMKTYIRVKSAEMVDDFHKRNQKYASRIRAEMRQDPYQKTSWKLWPEEKTKTYIMSSGYGHYKIGKSKDVVIREHNLQCSDPTVHLIAVCPHDIEYELHQKYAANRVSKEWFRFSRAELDNLIAEHGFVRVE